jgi:hypothetical protein
MDITYYESILSYLDGKLSTQNLHKKEIERMVAFIDKHSAKFVRHYFYCHPECSKRQCLQAILQFQTNLKNHFAF